MGYVYPPGGRAGSTVDVKLCGYDWTPDMQFFSLTPGVKLEITGPPGPILVPPPPYWFGAKAYLTALPLPREVPARLTLPPNLPSGPIRWQAANANGGTATGVFMVGAPSDGEELLENPRRRAPQPLPSLPAVVNGRLEKIEEVDRYRFTAPHAGPVTVELTARGLGAAFNGMVEIHDSSGRLVSDAADTTAGDLALTFRATGGAEYTLSLHDVDFRGDRSYVYRLSVRPGPRVLAALPAAGTRGETRSVEFLLDIGERAPKRVTREVRFPSEPARSDFRYRLPFDRGGAASWTLLVSDVPETVAASTTSVVALSAPGAVTGLLDGDRHEARHLVRGKAGEVWKIAAQARTLGSTLDVALRVLTPDGKEAAKSDDLPGTTDAGLEYTLPADGEYILAVADLSGKHAAGPGLYRLSVERSTPDFRLEAPQQFSIPLGGTADLAVKVIRQGGFKAPIKLSFSELPEGVTAPANFEIPAGAGEVKVPLRCAADVAVTAAMGSVTGSAILDGRPVTKPVLAPAGGNLTPFSPDENRIPELLFSVTMKPVCKVEPVDKDGGRRIHRGATYPAPVIITRLEGFQGEVGLQMAARQSYTCMGITGPDIVVPAGVTRTAYPCFMPEWLETSRTSRMITIAVAKVADPKGNVRHLVSLMDGRITMAMEGALLKITHAPEERTLRAGSTFRVPVKLARSPDLPLPVRVTLVLPDELQGIVKAEPLLLEPGRSEGEITVTTSGDPSLLGDQSLTFRAVAMLPGDLAVVSETQVPILFIAK
jgi:hypothetical protein